jgi:F-type H+-transporting ATPase subunit delta
MNRSLKIRLQSNMKKFPVQYARILLKLTDGLTGAPLDAALKSYMSYIVSEQAMKKMPYILSEYERLAHDAAGTAPLEVTAAHELTSSTKQAIEKEFGGTVQNVTIDTTLVGGVIVRKGNTILNASITKQLELLANSMK